MSKRSSRLELFSLDGQFLSGSRVCLRQLWYYEQQNWRIGVKMESYEKCRVNNRRVRYWRQQAVLSVQLRPAEVCEL